MRHALSEGGIEPLGELARSSVLIAFDYDGTLAPITDDPQRAPMRARTRDLLDALCARYPCAVISGRSRDDVVAQLGGAALRAVVGNHGAELPGREVPPRNEVVEWQRFLAERLRDVHGVRIEDKALSLSVHYRAATDKEHAQRAIADAVALLESVRVIGGKEVVNLVPRGAAHKGFALDELRRAAGCDASLYVGDDETDEDVFQMRRAHRIFTVRVGARPDSAAEYYLNEQSEVDDLITALLELRREPSRSDT
jgi:trehalose 6-phosphate phosphatase